MKGKRRTAEEFAEAARRHYAAMSGAAGPVAWWEFWASYPAKFYPAGDSKVKAAARASAGVDSGMGRQRDLVLMYRSKRGADAGRARVLAGACGFGVLVSAVKVNGRAPERIAKFVGKGDK